MSQPDDGGGRRGRTLGTRMIGVLALERQLFRDIDDDPFAQFQSQQIVMLVAVSTLVGLTATVGGPRVGLAAAIVIGARWWLMARILARLGDQWLPAGADVITHSRASRLIGYAQAPIMLAMLFPIPVVGPLVWIVINAWSIAAMNIAIQQLLPGVALNRYLWLLGAAALPQIVLLMLALV